MSDTIEIIKAIGAIITPIALAWIGVHQVVNAKKVEAYHKEVDGKMSKLLEVTGEAEKAKGNLEGRADLKQEQDDKK